MALFPCSVGRHTYPGKASSVYVGLVMDGDQADRWKLRFCGRHALEVYQHLAQFKVLIEDDAVSTNGSLDTCLTCGEPAGEVDWKLFVTCYPANQEREDYWGKLHVNCAVPEYLRRT